MEGNKPTSLTTERRPSRKRTITTLYETDSYVAVDKPYDMRIDKQKNDDGDPNLQDLVRASLPPAVRTELRHCHQLDYATSGVMLYATSKKAAAAAQICFQERRVQKEYLALVWGTPPSRELACAEPICQSTEAAFKMMIGDVDAVWPLLDKDASKTDRDERRRKRKHSGPAATTVVATPWSARQDAVCGADPPARDDASPNALIASRPKSCAPDNSISRHARPQHTIRLASSLCGMTACTSS